MQNKFSIILLILILALAGAVYNILLRLSVIEQQISAIEKPTANIATNIASNNTAAPGIQPAQQQSQTKTMEIIASDEGFLPSGFQMGPKDTVTISVTNQGESPHSFVIDDLPIDTGAIEPGQTKTITIGKQFDQPVELKYYSNIDSDNPEIFKGTIMVF